MSWLKSLIGRDGPPHDYLPSAQGRAVEKWQQEMWEELRHLEAERRALREERHEREHREQERERERG